MATQPTPESSYFLNYRRTKLDGVPGFLLMVQPPITSEQADILESTVGVEVERVAGSELHTNMFVSAGTVVGINHELNSNNGVDAVLDRVADTLVEYN